MRYFKELDGNEVKCVYGCNLQPNNTVEITEEEYTVLLAEFERKAEEERNNDYGIPNDVYDSIIDEYTLMLIEEGVIE